MQTKEKEIIRLIGSVKLVRRVENGNYTLGYWHNKEHRRLGMKTKIRRLAEKKALAFLASLESGQPVQIGRPPPRLAISDAIDQFVLAHDNITWKTETTLQNKLALRMMEVLMLRPCDVDLPGGWIHVRTRKHPQPWTTKTGKDRTVPIHPKLAGILQPFLTPKRMKQTYILCANPSQKFPLGTNHLNQREVNLIAQRYARAAGVPVGRAGHGFVFHSLRHHFETAAISSNVPQIIVDHWMGHVGLRSMGNHYFNLTSQTSQQHMKTVVF